MDENPDEDLEFPVPNYKMINTTYVGSHLKNYDSCVVLSHFKGHQMGGFGGALKNMSIGIASTKGKLNIHSAGRTTDQADTWANLPKQDDFLESMADACRGVIDYVGRKYKCYIGVANNLSVDCDCDSNQKDPVMNDLGIVASLDPVANDQAFIDLIWNSKDPGSILFN